MDASEGGGRPVSGALVEVARRFRAGVRGHGLRRGDEVGGGVLAGLAGGGSRLARRPLDDRLEVVLDQADEVRADEPSRVESEADLRRADQLSLRHAGLPAIALLVGRHDLPVGREPQELAEDLHVSRRAERRHEDAVRFHGLADCFAERSSEGLLHGLLLYLCRADAVTVVLVTRRSGLW